MFAMDEDGQLDDAASEQQEQGVQGLSTQGWQGDALSSLGSRDGEDSSASTSRSLSLFKKVTASPEGAPVAVACVLPAAGAAAQGDIDSSPGSRANGAVAIEQLPAAVSAPVKIKPLQGSPPAGVGLSPAAAGSLGRSPGGTPGSLRRSSLRRRSSSCCRTAHKSYRIYLPPQVLLLHLKRFQHDGRGQLNKLDTAVKFEFELDLSPFMAEDAPSSSSSSNGTQEPQQQQQLVYDLVGLVVHMGTMRGGHYIAYVKRVHGAEQQQAGELASGSTGCAQWYYVSDTSVRPVNVSEVAAAQAYMLLYVGRPAPEQQQEEGLEQGAQEGRMHDCGL